MEKKKEKDEKGPRAETAYYCTFTVLVGAGGREEVVISCYGGRKGPGRHTNDAAK